MTKADGAMNKWVEVSCDDWEYYVNDHIWFGGCSNPGGRVMVLRVWARLIAPRGGEAVKEVA